jgi:hypothetical protein
MRKFSNAISTRVYDLMRYDEGKNLAEKLLFSAPEYFILETRYCNWLVQHLLKILDRLNEKLMKNVTPNDGGHTYKLNKYLSDWLTDLLSWLSNIIEI